MVCRTHIVVFMFWCTLILLYSHSVVLTFCRTHVLAYSRSAVLTFYRTPIVALMLCSTFCRNYVLSYSYSAVLTFCCPLNPTTVTVLCLRKCLVCVCTLVKSLIAENLSQSNYCRTAEQHYVMKTSKSGVKSFHIWLHWGLENVQM